MTPEEMKEFCDAVERCHHEAAHGHPSVHSALVSINRLLPAVRALLEPAADVEAFIAEHRELVSVPGGNHWAVTEDDVRALAASLRAERGWVPVTERLPELFVEVLVRRGPRVMICRRWSGWSDNAMAEKGAEWIDQCDIGRGNVGWTHWMPLPTPPSDGGKEGA